MYEDILKDMTEEQATELLNTQFPEELEKEAEAELDRAALADNLYSYGWLQAERAIAEVESEGDLSKVASEEEVQAHEAAEEQVKEAIESLVASTGVADIEDAAELEKEAQAAAAFIFEGWSDCFEKTAAKGKLLKSVKKTLSSAKSKMEEAASKAKAAVKKHRGKAGLAAGLAAGYGGTALMSKKSSDATVGEITEAVLSRLDSIAIANEGVEKLAARGGKKGADLAKKLKGYGEKALAAAKKHRGKSMLGAGLLAGAAARKATE